MPRAWDAWEDGLLRSSFWKTIESGIRHFESSCWHRLLPLNIIRNFHLTFLIASRYTGCINMRDPLRKYRIFVNNGKNICLYKDGKCTRGSNFDFGKGFSRYNFFCAFWYNFFGICICFILYFIYMYIYERENLLNIENKDWYLIPTKWYLWTLCDSLYILVYDVYDEF